MDSLRKLTRVQILELILWSIVGFAAVLGTRWIINVFNIHVNIQALLALVLTPVGKYIFSEIKKTKDDVVKRFDKLEGRIDGLLLELQLIDQNRTSIFEIFSQLSILRREFETHANLFLHERGEEAFRVIQRIVDQLEVEIQYQKERQELSEQITLFKESLTDLTARIRQLENDTKKSL